MSCTERKLKSIAPFHVSGCKHPATRSNSGGCLLVKHLEHCMELVWIGLSVMFVAVAIYQFTKISKAKFRLRLFGSASYAVLVLSVLICFTIGDYYDIGSADNTNVSNDPFIWMGVTSLIGGGIALLLNIQKSNFLWGLGFTIIQVIMSFLAIIVLFIAIVLWLLHIEKQKNLKGEY